MEALPFPTKAIFSSYLLLHFDDEFRKTAPFSLAAEDRASSKFNAIHSGPCQPNGNVIRMFDFTAVANMRPVKDDDPASI